MSRKKAWRWFFAVGLGSGSLGMGADAEPPADTTDDAPGIVVEALDRPGDRADRLVAELLDAFNDGPDALARVLETAGADVSTTRYLQARSEALAPLDVHAVRPLGDAIVLVTARSEADDAWHQLTLGVSSPGVLRFVRVDPLRY